MKPRAFTRTAFHTYQRGGLSALLLFLGPKFGLLVDASGRPIAVVQLASPENITS